MPWLETDPIDQRLRLLEKVRLDRLSMTELCAYCLISPKTGDKWIEREAEEGRRGSASRRRSAPTACHASSVRTTARLSRRRASTGSRSSACGGCASASSTSALPGMPSENGAHERMHRSLKRRADLPARATVAAQQRAFNAFRKE